MHAREGDHPAAAPGDGRASATGPSIFEGAVEALTHAPSVHNTQPWRVRRIDRGLQLRTDRRRRLPATDGDAREMRLSCGAALLNIRLAAAAAGVRPEVRILPDPAAPDLVATVLWGRILPPTREERVLYAAIPHRRSDRRRFRDEPVTAVHRRMLRHAAECEGVWLHEITPAEKEPLLRLLRAAHRAQSADPAFRSEWENWTGRPDGTPTGVPASSGGTPPALNDVWMVRDFTHGETAAPAGPPVDRTGAGAGDDPLVLLVGTVGDRPVDQVRAGQALQRVLLTATALGLASSVVSAPVELPATRTALAALLGTGVHPQILVRVGHTDGPAPRTPRLSPSRIQT